MCRKVGADAGTGNNACDQGTEQAFTQAALPMDAKTSFIKGQDTEARCVRPEVIHPPRHHEGGHSPQPSEFAVCLRHACKSHALSEGQERDEDVKTPHQNRGGTTGKGQQGHTQQHAPNRVGNWVSGPSRSIAKEHWSYNRESER